MIELGAADLTFFYKVDLCDTGGMERENTLDANTIRDLADGERLIHTGTTTGNNDTLKMLDTLLVAFDDADRHVYGITRTELGYILTELGARNSANCVFHDRIK